MTPAIFNSRVFFGTPEGSGYCGYPDEDNLFTAPGISAWESVIHGTFYPVADECPSHEDNDIDKNFHNYPERAKIPKR